MRDHTGTVWQMGTAPARVWYAAYGSNMHAERFGYHLSGGRPVPRRGAHNW
jgi:hypothetical protein